MGASPAICLLAVALCLSGGFQQGYIASVLNQPYSHIEQFINETIEERFSVGPSKNSLNVLWSSLNLMFPVAVIIGQFFAAYLCRTLGRKGTALLASALYIPGTLLCSASHPIRSFEMLFFGRLIWSLANGIQTVNATVWIVECAPPHIRGRAAALQEFAMAFGSLISQGAGVPFSTPEWWPLVFVPNLPFVVIAALIFCLLPDSPSSILERSGDVDKAKGALALYYGNDKDTEVLEVKKKAAVVTKEQRSVAWLFYPFSLNDDKARVIRTAAWIGVLVKIAYIATGARTLRAYTTFVLHSLSKYSMDDAIKEYYSCSSSFIISIIRIPVTLIPVFLVDRVGRRPLINFSMVITVLCLGVMVASVTLGHEYKLASLIAFGVHLLVNAAGLGAVSRFYAAELVPRNLLLSATSTLAAFEALTKILVDFAFYPMADVVGVWSLLMFLVPSFVLVVVLWRICPETSNRTVGQVLEDIGERKKLAVTF